MSDRTFGPVEGAVAWSLELGDDPHDFGWRTASAIAREFRMPRRRVVHQLERLTKLGYVERADRAAVLDAQVVGSRMIVPPSVDDEPWFRWHANASAALYARSELADRPSPAQG